LGRHACGAEGHGREGDQDRGWTSLPEDEVARRSKRNFYRIIDRFGSRRDLLIGADGD
jgi:hypothetical protein